jgi:hypothetical protein
MIAALGVEWNWGAVLGLAVVFASGIFDALVLKRKDWACATWFIGLAATTAWIASGLTVARVCSGAVVFVAGLALMTMYYRRKSGGWPR